MRPLRALEQQGRCAIEVVHADANTGETDLDEWAERLGGSGPCLAVATHASNVTGVLLPVAALAEIAADHGVPFVIDASQSAGHVPLSCERLGASAVAMPGHKGLLGPTGTGLLYLAPGIEVEPLIRGGTGSQSELEVQPEFAPDRYESGTLNAMGIVGLGAAAEHLQAVGIDRVEARLAELGRRFRAALSAIDGLMLYGPEDPAEGVGILSLNIEGVPCATVARLIDDDWGVMTRAGLHCSPAAHRTLGTAPDGTLRFSWSHETSDEDIDTAVEALQTVARNAEPSRALGLRWGGVVSFFASEHAMRSERLMQRAGLPARLVPGPREVSPNCGVAVAFRWEDEPAVERLLNDSKIRFEAIHEFDLDDGLREAS